MDGELASRVAEALEPAGFDLVADSRVSRYNAAVPPEWRLPDFGDGGSLALVVGGTRRLWRAFRTALTRGSVSASAEHPLDDWVRASVSAALGRLELPRFEVRYAADRPPRGVAIQRLAEVAGLAFVSPANLAVHPRYGPWISLHAAVVLDAPGPTGPAAERPRDLCADCRARCVPLLDRALERSGALLAGDPDRALAENWRAWLAVRDACPSGREWRYGEDQLRYGYTKDRSILG
jgi:methylmalonic aciduria homocystinuria type C protein